MIIPEATYRQAFINNKRTSWSNNSPKPLSGGANPKILTLIESPMARLRSPVSWADKLLVYDLGSKVIVIRPVSYRCKLVVCG